jgi:hypothetical protein
MATNNAINLSASGITGYDGTGTFSGTPVVAHNILLGGSSSDVLVNVAPSATSGVALVSAGASADPAYGTVVVAGGGTGLATLTAYELIAAGTTSTGNVQQIGIGTSGQVLTSNGAGALPTFQPLSATSQVPYINVTTTSQTMALNTFYIANNAGLVTFTPPAVCAVGTVFAVQGAGAGGWSINLATNSQTFNYGSSAATTAIASSNQFDAVQFVCVIANSAFALIDAVGNPNVS